MNSNKGWHAQRCFVATLFGLCVGASAGCGRQAIATTDALPVRRVVIYRNGIAYFERSGHVNREEVRFKMKGGEVGDFLATLAVMEHGGSSVRAVAFPLRTDPSGADNESDSGTKPREPRAAMETVVLSLDGKEHDLDVGYVAESPVWRPSYRLVVRPHGEAELQAWGIVHNLSGEDWKSVHLSLVAGAPLAFQADLGTPVIPPRPFVGDQGEVIAAVPHGETSLAQEPEPPPPPATPPEAAPSDSEDASSGRADASRDLRASGTVRAQTAPRAILLRGAAKKAAANGAEGLATASSRPMTPHATAASAPASPAALISAPRNLSSLAALAQQGGSTRYDLPLPVTIPDRSATMVMLLSKRLPGESLFLFAPDGDVTDSTSHPFRVARFTNTAGGVLEHGPIAVFEEGAFLGQGMLDPLPLGATATVPFALERSIAVDRDDKHDELGARVAKIENSELWVERDSVTQTKYRIVNGGDEGAKLLVKHPRIHGSKLFSPPNGTEDNVGTSTALIPTSVASHAKSELVVDERTTVRRSADWFTPLADNAVAAFLADPHSDPAVVRALKAAWLVRSEVVRHNDAVTSLRAQAADLSRAVDEVRRDLRAIEKSKSADALRQTLTVKLAKSSNKLDELNRQIVEIDAKLAELGVAFREAIHGIRVAGS
ncbi:MAG: DUF4139 domain-containing protein [Polyangiaceae bacterium]